MGFRDMALFNQAMLAKQGWRLMMHPESLCAKVLKGKYFPNGDFVSATRKKKSSETWRAILYGREALLKGLIKRIGPGNINIWSERWIGSSSSRQPLFRMVNSNVEQVHQLFLPGTRSWDEAVVRNNFCSVDADEILKMKPGTHLHEDVLAWAPELKGFFIVRSCYCLLKNEGDQKEVCSSSETANSDGERWWKRLWNLKVPPKVRIFWWRAMNNFLPAKAELKRRHVAREDHCEACGRRGETLYHVAFECTFAIRFWEAALDMTGCKIPRFHPATWTRDLLSGEMCSDKDGAFIICGIWSLWNGRNARRHGRDKWSAKNAVKHIAAMVEELLCLELPVQIKPVRDKQTWQKPGPGWWKVNTDASFQASSSSGAGGAVIRGDDGLLLAARSLQYSCLGSVLTAEALAARDGLLLAAELAVEKIVLEVDNLPLFNFLRSDEEERSEVAGLCQEIRELSRLFRGFNLSFLNREGNKAAHLCASLTSSGNPVTSWLNIFPAFLVQVAETDCKHVSA
jgi:hypothetical protein